MASGKIVNKTTLSGSISAGNNLKSAAVTGGSGTTDHSRLVNRAAPDQHPVEAITGLRSELDSKLDSNTALPLIDKALTGKAKGLYFDAKKELARKAYWYLTSEIDEATKLGTKESIISGPYDLGMGGGNGTGSSVSGGGVTTVTVTPVDWPNAVLVGNDQIKTDLVINWSSKKDDTPITETGTVYVLINDKQVAVLAGKQPGEVVIKDIASYKAFTETDNKVEVRVMDIYGTINNVVRTIKGVSLLLKSDFVAKETPFPNGNIDYTYIPVGDADKVVYFELDGDSENPDTINTNVSNTQGPTYTLRGLSHGSHTLKVYFKADVGGTMVTSNTLFYDLICVDPKNSQPIIASDFEALEQVQYSGFNIPYYVYANNRVTLPVTLKISFNGKVTTTNTTATIGKLSEWPCRLDEPGQYTLEISSGTAKPKVFNINVAKSTVNVQPETTNLILALTAHNRNNADATTRDTWSYTTAENPPVTYNCTLNNFNWSSNGWIYKDADNGSSYFLPRGMF